ncbi:MAG: hypothetical protein LBK99_11695 [Opitutaceae bacterium]|jgi:hypothetical protein|nr:hypothetical protein [Opitutaceae bacterium]
MEWLSTDATDETPFDWQQVTRTVRRTADGFVLEARIPWSVISLNPAGAAGLGMNVLFGITSADGQREQGAWVVMGRNR